MSLFGKRVFADIIKDLETRQHWIRVGPKSGHKCPEKQRGKGQVKMEAKTEVIQLQVKNTKYRQKPPEREAWNEFSLRTSRRNQR